MNKSSSPSLTPIIGSDKSVNRTEWLLSLLLGAVLSTILLTALGFRARELWSPFGQSEIGGHVFRGLIFSAMVGGLVATIAMRGLDRPSLRMLPGAACALGWGILGWLFHTLSSTRFPNFLSPGQQNENTLKAVFWSNGVSQPLCVAFGLLIAAIMGWLAEKRFFAPQRLAQRDSLNKKTKNARRKTPVAVAEDATENIALSQTSRAFSRNLTFPLMVAVPGLFLLSIFGLTLLALPLLNGSELPASPFLAAIAALLCVVSFGGGAWLTRRFFGSAATQNGGENTVAYLIAAPIAVAFVCGLWFQSGGTVSVLQPAARVIWDSSPFEAASWGAFGSALGFWLAGRKQIRNTE